MSAILPIEKRPADDAVRDEMKTMLTLAGDSRGGLWGFTGRNSTLPASWLRRCRPPAWCMWAASGLLECRAGCRGTRGLPCKAHMTRCGLSMQENCDLPHVEMESR